MFQIQNLHKTYPNSVHALKGITFDVKKGEFLVILGLSGSGKSTLLRCLNLLHPITKGKIIFKQKRIDRLKGIELRKIRGQIGMIFQHFNLIERKKVITNVLTGSLHRTSIFRSLFEIFNPEDYLKAQEYLDLVGLSDKTHQRVDHLSGGQKQRVAIARALMQNPSVILADEPVASLDPAMSDSIMQYLKKINQDLGVTILCNLHFLSLVRKYADRVIALKDGAIVFEGLPTEIDEQWFKQIYGNDAVEVSPT